eukprot:TRINITY_DN2232_c0_g1_i3.p1 TRINITY_DN2232_c0_g1~~TRINITY_DN2232_c0_g1_i3.p1  ORF type:complete len:294 (-),score=124.31 TRINITY_DN2232_c0_g1_i3:352-1233(-)
MASLEQPKKAVSAYWLWLAENRAEIAKKVGSSKCSDVAKAAGEMWKGLPEAKKAPFEQKAAAAKDEYDKAMAAFREQGGVPAARKSKKDKEEKQKKKVKDENAPKKPVGGAYGVYLAEKREEIKQSLPKDHKMTDVAKKAGELWKMVCDSESEKKKYQDIFDAKSVAYKKDLEEYKQNTGNDADEDEEAEESPKKELQKKRESPKKRTKPEGEGAKAPVAKRGRGTAKATPEEVAIDDTVLKEAQKAGLVSALKNLANRDDVKTGSHTSRALLEALKSSNGLVNPARRALLGA